MGVTDAVPDPMADSGTTCVEAKLLGRSCVGVDIDYGAVVLTLHMLYYLERAVEEAAGGSLARSNDSKERRGPGPGHTTGTLGS